ncbi:MAG: adenosylcobinamide-GDP ribazoletransferase [Deltaproteobacteria bacterium]|nr:adenosylcobinamide-GDP ribazoletransferase [Deltaproteobacteria bacterium]
MHGDKKKGLGGLVTALRTLTVFPVPGGEGGTFPDSLPWFPCVGLMLGLIHYFLGVTWMGILAPEWSWGGALVLITADIIMTRGLHLDGLADWADAIGKGGDRETKLSTMKDPHVGAFGVIALVTVLLARWSAMERILSQGSILRLVLVMVLSRDIAVELVITLPYARSSGQGMGQPFSQGVTQSHRLKAHLLSLGICVLFGLLGVVSFAMGWALSKAFRSIFKRDFGGFTGDLLGMALVTLEVVLLFLHVLLFPLSVIYWPWTILLG